MRCKACNKVMKPVFNPTLRSPEHPKGDWDNCSECNEASGLNDPQKPKDDEELEFGEVAYAFDEDKLEQLQDTLSVASAPLEEAFGGNDNRE